MPGQVNLSPLSRVPVRADIGPIVHAPWEP